MLYNNRAKIKKVTDVSVQCGVSSMGFGVWMCLCCLQNEFNAVGTSELYLTLFGNSHWNVSSIRQFAKKSFSVFYLPLIRMVDVVSLEYTRSVELHRRWKNTKMKISKVLILFFIPPFFFFSFACILYTISHMNSYECSVEH